MDPHSISPDPALDMPTPFVDLLPPPLPAPRRGRLGWFGHLSLLTAWLLGLIFFGHLRDVPAGRHVAFHNVRSVVLGLGVDALLFGVICGLAWWCSRATASEWLLRWRGGAGPVWRGILYSVAFRVVLFVMMLAVVLVLVALRVVDLHDTSRLRSHVDEAVSYQALVHDRAFFWCVVTLLSAFAGVLEETWRGGMLAGLAGAFPRAFGGPVGRWMAIIPVAVLFGFGHLYMGWTAVAQAGVLGLGLGAITVWHRTIWDAAIAHALFDATSLAVLAWVLQRNPQLIGR